MSLINVKPGSRAPGEINVVIEIPAHSDPVKYEVDKDTGALFVDRFMSAAMFYPCAYGYVPETLSEDGDPLDVLVHTPYPVVSGCVIRSKPIGVLKMEDEAGLDAKLLAVPVGKLLPSFKDVNEVEHMPATIISQIEHFFEHYKDLEKDKWVRIIGWGDSAEARTEIEKAIAAVS
ncbi:MAG: inorganic diphosphatase [Gammaproteobacteria bacterium]|nr:inorganic diphosphatase [Gammaproteobacteria bacterium]